MAVRSKTASAEKAALYQQYDQLKEEALEVEGFRRIVEQAALEDGQASKTCSAGPAFVGSFCEGTVLALPASPKNRREEDLVIYTQLNNLTSRTGNLT